jgi:hypothetical protein
MSSQQPQSEVGILRLRAENKPRTPENWKYHFGDPVPLCLRFVASEELRRTNPVCAICLKYFSVEQLCVNNHAPPTPTKPVTPEATKLSPELKRNYEKKVKKKR